MLILRDDERGPQNPNRGSPARRPGSVRRTTSIATMHPDGPRAPATVVGSGRDLLTRMNGQTRVVDHARFDAVVDGGTITAWECLTHASMEDALVGTTIGPGFRRQVRELLPGADVDGTLLHLLLDDWVGANLVAGYSQLRAGVSMGPGKRATMDHMADMCAGWARDGVMLDAIREHGQVPVPIGPIAPPLPDPDDPDSWHELPVLTSLSTARVRRLDAWATPDGYGVDVVFRDAYADADGQQSSVHEYSLTATFDTDLVVTGVEVKPDVLPWKECPGALASAGRLIGVSTSDIRRSVAKTFHGIQTCSHLNDVYRSLADVRGLSGLLEERE